MHKNERNRLEWDNPNNWSGQLYFSKEDSRIWVPKRVRAFGYTLNLGHPSSTWWLLGLVLLPVVVLVSLCATHA
jgi:uncharacterized membrane protein